MSAKHGNAALSYKLYNLQYVHNCEKLGNFKNYIYNQEDVKVANLKFANAFVKKVGCETIAVYNIMKLIGKFQYYPNVLIECEMNGLAWLSGHFGIWPKNLYKYFDAHNISYEKTKKFDTWISQIKKKKRGILSAWNAWHWFKGLHTVMVTYKDGKYYIYNALPNSTKPETFESKQELKDYMEGSFIIGYTF